MLIVKYVTNVDIYGSHVQLDLLVPVSRGPVRLEILSYGGASYARTESGFPILISIFVPALCAVLLTYTL